MTPVSYVDISAQWRDEKEDLLPILEETLAAGLYVGGNPVDLFEEAVAGYFSSGYAVALNSGTDALVCALFALGVRAGDEVITPPNSFVASTAAIVHLGAKPVFVDVKADQNIDEGLIESAISEKTKAIMPVHLTGRMAAMPEICEIAQRHNLVVIEDAAQSAGSMLHGRSAGTWGNVGCFSAHPLKNLNACGDAGFIITNDEALAKKIRSIRNHGLIDRETVEEFGVVSRMDTLQAAVLRFRLERLGQVISQRRENVNVYRDLLNVDNVFHPDDAQGENNSWHTFVIQVDRRDELKDYLMQRGIETAIHYPVPIHLQPAARDLGYAKGDFPVTEQQSKRILTLPIHQYLTKEQLKKVASSVNEFFSCS